jgi:hypothetical protein
VSENSKIILRENLAGKCKGNFQQENGEGKYNGKLKTFRR